MWRDSNVYEIPENTDILGFFPNFGGKVEVTVKETNPPFWMPLPPPPVKCPGCQENLVCSIECGEIKVECLGEGEGICQWSEFASDVVSNGYEKAVESFDKEYYDIEIPSLDLCKQIYDAYKLVADQYCEQCNIRSVAS
jgi:hypothetical protein